MAARQAPERPIPQKPVNPIDPFAVNIPKREPEPVTLAKPGLGGHLPTPKPARKP